MLIALYFMFTYLVAIGIANTKAKKEYGWNTQLLITIVVFPVAIPFIIMMEIHAFLNKKCTF
ncbi:MAG TPA: hypothetical protein VFS71_04175 [Flavobacterium sp.]|uniref:hypothetical protein n=1 Tax=Flavobacterium sp. TaxID=239 RepID=UPI002DBF7BC3|nr:hypothetical protein [Flavobacterium sp.]HEU4788860.1 hypothetical protein [Flavobacterium sp.]